LLEPQVRNFDKYKILGQYVWPNSVVFQTWEEEVDYLESWMLQRMNWMDLQIEKFKTAVPTTTFPQISMIEPRPNPARGSTFFKYKADNYRRLEIQLFDVNGRLLDYTGSMPTGENAVFEMPLPATAGVYFWKIFENKKTVRQGKIVVY
jgi:hypothetical protein